MSPVSRLALLMAALSLAACGGNLSVVGGPDAGTDLGPTDLGVLDAGALDVPIDTGPEDTGPPDTGPADTGPSRCAQDSDCAGNPGGPACDVASGRCVTCTPASDRCPAGQYCVGATNACAPGCRDDASCMGASSDGGATGSRRCDTTTRACVECIADEHCPSGTLCVGNLCVAGCNAGRACPASQTCCSGACIDAQTNTAHCGACDQRCAVANASPLCRNGTCTVATCVAPFGDCDTSPSNGCEIDTSRDTAHCGGCGMACAARPNTVASCAAGACAYACAMGFADCDGDATNGCEVDTRASASHCGACGARCAPANATAACVAGVCTVGSCATGFGDCDGNATNGCETDLPVSVSHCGACGNRCPANPNAAPVCVAGSCSSVCTAGFADCDSNPATGCEVDVRVDSANCGSCGRACSNVGGTSTCTTGACVLRCTRGRGDCDGNPLNGCEVDLTTSSAHCGGCGVSCDTNAACRINEGLSGVCACNAGYAGSGRACMDVDECLTGNGGCSSNATCRNTVGGRTCTCNTAFTGDGVTCAPVVIELTIAGNTTGYNVFLQAGAPMIPRVVRVTVNPGVVVSSTSPSAPAFVSGALRPGSELRIVNHGTITGAGGAGGSGGGFINASPNPQSAGASGRSGHLHDGSAGDRQHRRKHVGRRRRRRRRRDGDGDRTCSAAAAAAAAERAPSWAPAAPADLPSPGRSTRSAPRALPAPPPRAEQAAWAATAAPTPASSPAAEASAERAAQAAAPASRALAEATATSAAPAWRAARRATPSRSTARRSPGRPATTPRGFAVR
ncbi:MAG: hypothetical protein IPF99_42940 [Deltaproteobacteria bacterium]|nr:hypothetical protein [Deltaproteobacteria bacterium]